MLISFELTPLPLNFDTHVKAARASASASASHGTCGRKDSNSRS